jgi:hypothetical protein
MLAGEVRTAIAAHESVSRWPSSEWVGRYAGAGRRTMSHIAEPGKLVALHAVNT